MMRGRMGAALQSMRMHVADEKRGRELALLGSQHEDQLRSAAVRELRAVLARLHKGVVAMHVERWRSNKKWDIMKEGAAMRARLEAEMMAGSQHAALRQLCLVLSGMDQSTHESIQARRGHRHLCPIEGL